jgi:hypothetical protein
MFTEPSPRLILAGLFCFIAVPVGFGQDGTTAPGDAIDLPLIEGVYITQKQDASKPLNQLNEKFRAALEKQKTDLQAAGNLDGVLEAQKGIVELDKGTTPDGVAANPSVARLEEIYLKQRAEVEKAIEEPLRKAHQDYITHLEALALRLTKAGKIDEAIKARNVLEEAKKRQVAAATLKEMVKPGEPTVEILSASYGTGGKYADVTARLKHYVEDKKETFWANGDTMKTDPNPGWNKNVSVRYLKDGVKRERSWGRHEPLRIEDFYGPQDKDELTKWLADTSWKAEVQVNFKENKTFDVQSRLAAGTWTVSQHRKVTMVWSAGEVIEGVFDPTWTSFEEQSGKKRMFRKTR